jgi:hypothetical protein
MNERRYVGIDKDPQGAMNPTGNIIRDAWVFGLIPESETCEGWNQSGLQDLYEKVTAAWAPYAHLPSRLPPDLLERHQRIYKAAVDNARDRGWDPDNALSDED